MQLEFPMSKSWGICCYYTMKRISCIIFFSLFALCTFAQATDCDVDSLLAQMTTREKTRLLVGAGWGSLFAGFNIPFCHGIVPGAAGETRSISRLGVRPLVMADGPAGLRLKLGMRATAFPVGMSLACSRDTALLYEVGAAMADEARLYGIDAILTPGMNLQTYPLCGRNYEYYSDDPQLTAQMATAMVRGVQSRGVAACIKHLACNNQENDRKNVNVVMSEDSLRRIYLKPFELTIRQAYPAMVMSSYNLLNGVRTQESPWLLTQVLRRDWEYDGLVLTDWTGVRHSVLQIEAGNDLLMPGMKRQRWQIRRALRKGKLSMERVDESVKRILKNRRSSHYLVETMTAERVDSMFRAHALLARRAAAAGMVFLKGGPLERRGSFSLYGSTSYEMLIGGTGSGHVNPLYTVNMNQALRFAGMQVNDAVEQMYLKYLRGRGSHKKSTFYLKKFLGNNGPKEKAVPRAFIEVHEPETDAAIITLGRMSGEGKDRTMTEGDYLLTPVERQLLTDVSQVYRRAGKPVIVVLNVCGPIETQSWSHLADTILVAWLPGQEAGNAVCDVLLHGANPNAQLSMQWEGLSCNHAGIDN